MPPLRLDGRDRLLRPVGAAVVGQDHAGAALGEADGGVAADAGAAAGDEGDLGVWSCWHALERTSSAASSVRTEMPRRCTILLDCHACPCSRPLARRATCMFLLMDADRRAAGADRPPRPGRRDDGDRRRPALGRRPAGRAAGVDLRDGHGGHRPGREAPGHRRSRLRLRPRPVPGRLGRPADHRPLHARVRGRAGAGVRADPPAVGDRVAAARRRPAPRAPGPRPRASASPTPRPSSSTPSCAWCACSTARATATSSRR